MHFCRQIPNLDQAPASLLHSLTYIYPVSIIHSLCPTPTLIFTQPYCVTFQKMILLQETLLRLTNTEKCGVVSFELDPTPGV